MQGLQVSAPAYNGYAQGSQWRANLRLAFRCNAQSAFDTIHHGIGQRQKIAPLAVVPGAQRSTAPGEHLLDQQVSNVVVLDAQGNGNRPGIRQCWQCEKQDCR